MGLSSTALRGILYTDGLRLVRDRFLLGMATYLIGIAVAIRLALPWIAGELEARLGFELEPWFPLITSHFVVGLAGLLAGIIGGFMLLESREDRTIMALQVSPVSLSSYVGVLAVAIMVMAALNAVLQAVIVGVGLPPWPAVLAACVLAAPTALVFALFVATVASNKTEAFAYLKLCAVAPLIPSGAYFLAEPWQWLAGIYPSYWAAKAYWVAEAGGRGWGWWLIGGAVVSAIWVGVVGRAFLRAARR